MDFHLRKTDRYTEDLAPALTIDSDGEQNRQRATGPLKRQDQSLSQCRSRAGTELPQEDVFMLFMRFGLHPSHWRVFLKFV